MFLPSKTKHRTLPSSEYFVYILTNKSGTLYIGVTNHLARRITQHRLKLIPGFTAKYNINRLIYFEIYHDPVAASRREQQLKGWNRSKKLVLIQKVNPKLEDLKVV